MKRTLYRNKLLYVLVLILALVVMMPSMLSKNVDKVSAATPISSTSMDSNLYDKLLSAGNFRVLYENSFVEAVTLTLKGSYTGADRDATEEPSVKINDVSGLAQFTFPKLTTLNLSNNAITSLSSEVLSRMPNLETLIVDNNRIDEIDLSENPKLKVVKAQNNYLTEINAIFMDPSDSVLDLSGNYIESVEDIVLPIQRNGVNMQVILLNNSITDYVADAENPYKFFLGVQGVQTESNMRAVSQNVVYYPLETSDVNVEIYSTTVTETIVNGEVKKHTVVGDLVKSIDNSQVTEKLECNLDVGTYQVKFTRGGEELDVTNNETTPFYYTNNFSIVPTKPVCYFLIDGKREAVSTRISKKTTLEILTDSEADIYVKIGNGEEKKIGGTKYQITQGGNYLIRVRAEIDGVSSEESIINVRASNSLVIPDVVLLIIVAVFALVVFAVAYPLIGKYVLNK